MTTVMPMSRFSGTASGIPLKPISNNNDKNSRQNLFLISRLATCVPTLTMCRGESSVELIIGRIASIGGIAGTVF